jgi:hypothetical protein
MNHRLTTGLFLCIGFFCSLFTVTAQQAVRPTEPLRIVSYGGDLKTFLGQMPNSFDITMGFEISPLHPRSYVSFEVHDATFADMMNALVKARPEYRWRQAGKVVEVYPAIGTNPILDLTVSSFHVKDCGRGSQSATRTQRSSRRASQ